MLVRPGDLCKGYRLKVNKKGRNPVSYDGSSGGIVTPVKQLLNMMS